MNAAIVGNIRSYLMGVQLSEIRIPLGVQLSAIRIPFVHLSQNLSFNQDKPIISLVRVDHSSDFSRSLVITLHSSSLALFFTGLPLSP